MFKVNRINGDYIETTTNVSSILGRVAHKFCESYFKLLQAGMKNDVLLQAQKEAEKELENYSDGLIEYSDTVKDRAGINERFAFVWTKLFSELQFDIKKIVIVEKKLTHEISLGDKKLPIPITAIADLVYYDSQDRLIIRDHKFVGKFSGEQEIDGAKLLQAVFNYFTVYKETGVKPYSIIFEEFKYVPNRDKNERQLKEYEFVYEEMPLMFDLFYRFYEDITNALLGKQVYVPNLMTFFDKEVSIVAYINRLDVDLVREEQFRKFNVDNITDFLKQKVQSDTKTKKYLETINKKFISATTLDYKSMTNEEKIRMKLAEHGIAVEFSEKIVGSAITLYCYEPSVGVKMGKIEGFTKDIEQVIGKSGIRILAPIPNSTLIGFEVPNDTFESPYFPADFVVDDFKVAIGQDLFGKIKTYDIRKAPHMLVAGSTGSGKSVFLHTLIKQLQSIKNVELHLFDPKQVEFVEYADDVKEYLTEPFDIETSLSTLVEEMNARYTMMKNKKVKDIKQLLKVPYKFVIIDEFADISHRPATMECIRLLAQKGRACGIHLIIATQRASAQVINGDIKVNFPAKAIFKMAKQIDSLVMLDEGGAEKLLGKGDCLFSTDQGMERLQGYKV